MIKVRNTWGSNRITEADLKSHQATLSGRNDEFIEIPESEFGDIAQTMVLADQ